MQNNNVSFFRDDISTATVGRRIATTIDERRERKSPRYNGKFEQTRGWRMQKADGVYTLCVVADRRKSAEIGVDQRHVDLFPRERVSRACR